MATSSPATPFFKNLLQEYCQKTKIMKLPRYSSSVSREGNRSLFRATVTVMGQDFESEGCFSTKKAAEQNAAKAALQRLALLPSPENKTSPETKIQAQESNAGASRIPGPTVEDGSPVKSIPSASVTELSVASPVSYKNLLQERAQTLGVGLPVYDTRASDKKFVSVVTFNGQSFQGSYDNRAKKQAEQSAASVALFSLGFLPSPGSPCSLAPPPCSTPVSVNYNMLPSPNLTPQSLTLTTSAEISYKNLLQEHMQHHGMKLPVYNTAIQGAGFVCSVQFGRESVPSTAVYPNKKQAEQMAAKETLLFLGLNPEEMNKFKGTKKRKLGQGQRRLHLPRTGERTSWVHSNNGHKDFDSSWEEVDYYWEQSIKNKRPRLDTNTHQQTWNLPPIDPKQHMSVGEVWKEKKNIVLVGDAKSSFVLHCSAVPVKCQLFCERMQSLVTLEPGHRIIGLDARYIEHKGKIALEAERCMDVFVPASPDHVLTSCGVVLLYQDPESRSSIQVLLKRYLVSQAFINVMAAMAQYFRRRITGRPIKLDMTSSVEHIRDWMLQEVQYIAAMNETALRQMFSHMWKFSEKWCGVLEPPLPKDLKELQARAIDELARRQVSDVSHSEDFYRPWSLPKGNFKHRTLSTGILIESPAECAVRELREETGIQLDASEVRHLPCVELPHTDNLNPHCGDIVRYYLYVYSSDSFCVEELMNTTEDADSSILWEPGASQGEGAPTAVHLSPFLTTQDSETPTENIQSIQVVKDLGTELQDTDESNVMTCGQSKPSASEGDCQEKDEETQVADNSNKTVLEAKNICETHGVSSKQAEVSAIEEQREPEEQSGKQSEAVMASQTVETSLHPCDSEKSTENSFVGQDVTSVDSNGGAIQEKRGLKRKRDSDDEDDFTAGCPTAEKDHKTPPASIGHPGTCFGTTAMSTKSPQVQGGLHEECAWLPLDEAREKSPVFKDIFDTTQFQYLLASIEC